MKIYSIFKSTLLVASLLSSMAVYAVSGVYGGGPLYNTNYSMNELKNSGFTNVIIWTIHVENDGSLGLNGEFPLVSNGTYIGNNHFPDFPSTVASLKGDESSITRLEFGLSGAGSGTYNNVRDLLSCGDSHCGTGPNSILYRNFKALLDVYPSIDAVNNDDESTYHLSSSVQFHIMLADLGIKTAIVPYSNKNFWQSLVTQVNQARPGAIDALYLQVYAGGASNNPCAWDLGLPVYPGLWSLSSSPNTVQSRMQSWNNSCGNIVKGGFMWLYDDFDNSSQVAEYAEAINSAFGGPTGETITARASIHNAENQEKAFDGNPATKWLDNAGVPNIVNPSWIQIHYPSAKVVNSLTLVSANDAFERDPENIELLASNDGIHWLTLVTWSNLEFPTRFFSKNLSFVNTASFTDFRLNITKNKNNDPLTQIAEILLTNESQIIVDHSSYPGVSIEARTRIHAAEAETMAFDDDNSTKWLDNGGEPSINSPSWIQASLPIAKVVNSLAITSANDAIDRDPLNFILSGSNDNGANWTEIDSWNNIIWITRFERQLFSVGNTNAYSTYRLSTTKNFGNSSMTQIAEIELLGPLF